MLKKFEFMGNKYKVNEVFTAYALLMPAILAILVLFIVPMLQVVYFSFTNYNLIKGVMDLNGISNYQYILTDTRFLKSMANTFLFGFLKIVIGITLSLTTAFLLDLTIPFRRFIRTVYFAPVVVPVVACGMVWLWFYDPGIGPFNQILGWFNLPAQKWIYGANTAMLSIVIFSVWHGLGYNMVLFLAGLQGVAGSYIEAAKMEGASELQIIRKIKIPLLSPILSFALMMEIINALKAFTEVDVMTPQGGPAYSTALAVNYIYEKAFTDGQMGRGAAASMILFVVILLLTMLQRKLTKSEAYTD